MKSIRIYQADFFETGKSIQMDKASSNHLIKVLRLKNGFTFTLFNGNGFEYTARLEISDRKAIAHIESSNKISNESDLNIHLLQGISKGDRMDFAIQKSIELGATSITPVITERTVVNLKDEREQKKLQHWQAIAISACEQSGRSILPSINPVRKLAQTFIDDKDSLKLVLDPLSNNHLSSLSAKKNIQILIGPEGGLTEAEVILAKENGFKGIKLGPRVLRTETAALAAITAVQLIWGDLNK